MVYGGIFVNGTMVISLDFEMMWGVLDHESVETYGNNILNGKTAIYQILELFNKYQIHATWGIVGFLCFHDTQELRKNFPITLPNYVETKYNSYSYIDKITKEQQSFFFAPELINTIHNYENQEIASHTFSHYFCLEDGQTQEDFDNDLRAMLHLFKKMQLPLSSIIFPRNQFNQAYLDSLCNTGVITYRGNEQLWCYNSSKRKNNFLIKRAIRLFDTYFNICGNLCYDYSELESKDLVNIKSSRFLRPYSKKLRFGETFKLKRIMKQMTYAAKNKKVFHMWWHPHNFGNNLELNLNNLEILLLHYKNLQQDYGFQSLNMHELGALYHENFNSGSRV